MAAEGYGSANFFSDLQVEFLQRSLADWYLVSRAQPALLRPCIVVMGWSRSSTQMWRKLGGGEHPSLVPIQWQPTRAIVLRLIAIFPQTCRTVGSNQSVTTLVDRNLSYLPAWFSTANITTSNIWRWSKVSSWCYPVVATCCWLEAMGPILRRVNHLLIWWIIGLSTQLC